MIERPVTRQAARLPAVISPSLRGYRRGFAYWVVLQDRSVKTRRLLVRRCGTARQRCLEREVGRYVRQSRGVFPMRLRWTGRPAVGWVGVRLVHVAVNRMPGNDPISARLFHGEDETQGQCDKDASYSMGCALGARRACQPRTQSAATNNAAIRAW